MLRILPIFCAAALLVASGVVHRYWTGAWTRSEIEPAVFAVRWRMFSMNVGEWQGVDGEIDEGQLTTAEAVGHVLRKYVRRDSGAEVSILILCGRPGPMCVHQPTICYGGLGFEKEKETASKFQAEGEGPEADFNRLDLIKHERVGAARLRIYYGWNSGGTWRAFQSAFLLWRGRRPLQDVCDLSSRAGERIDRERSGPGFPPRTSPGTSTRPALPPRRGKTPVFASVALFQLSVTPMIAQADTCGNLQTWQNAEETPVTSSHLWLPLQQWYLPCKSVVSFLLAASLLLISAPVILLTALLVKLTSSGPVFYSQTRVGKNGLTLPDLQAADDVPQLRKSLRSPLVHARRPAHHAAGLFAARTWTNARAMERRARRDVPDRASAERPEFIPRLAKALPHYTNRLLVKPGMTGLAQVHCPPTPIWTAFAASSPMICIMCVTSARGWT